MRDAKVLTVETAGPNIFFHRDAPAPAPVPAKPDAFRKGKSAAEARLISRPAHTRPPVADFPNDSDSPLDRWLSCPLSLRPPGRLLAELEIVGRGLERTTAGLRDRQRILVL